MGLPALQSDYLFLGALIKARLLAQVADMPVETCERPEQVLEADRRAHMLMVLWAGDRFDTGAGGRAEAGAQLVWQRWLVCVALNNVGAAKDARHLAAGPLLSAVHQALAGWRPDGCPRPLLRANAPLAPVFTDRKAIYPLGFEIQLSL